MEVTPVRSYGKRKNPRIGDKYMIKKILFFALLGTISCKPTLVPPEKAVEKLGPDPYFQIDGNRVGRNELGKYNPEDIAVLTTYYDKDATKRFGDSAKDGAVVIETRKFATDKFEAFFKSYSKEYARILETTDKSEIQYILNDRVLIKDFEGDLASVSKKLIKSLTIVNQHTLSDNYKVFDKKVGVVIKSKKPKDLYNADQKF
jgi:hypothetical protein